MKKQRWKITGPVSVGGHLPGEEFDVLVNDKGVPVDAFWRKRQRDESSYQLGHVGVIADGATTSEDKSA
jgi:hypothetical protein